MDKIICKKDFSSTNPNIKYKKGEILSVNKNITAPYLSAGGRWTKRYDYTITKDNYSLKCIVSDSNFFDHFDYLENWRAKQIDKILL